MQDELDSVSDEELDVEQEVVSLEVTCPSCSSEVEIPKSGVFRCPECKSVSSVDEDGNISLREIPSTNLSQKFEKGIEKFSSWVKPAAQKFGEQAEKTTQDFASWSSSTGENISEFNINSPNMRGTRIWLLVLGSILVWFLFIFILGHVLWLWLSIIGLSDVVGWQLSSIFISLLSCSFILRIYTHCTNNRNLEINAAILSDSDPHVFSHLFQIPSRQKDYALLFRAFLLDTAVGYGFWFFFGMLSIFSYISFHNLSSPISSIDIELLLIFLSLAVVTPIVEELLFRGFVFDLFSEIYSKWTTIILSSILFGIAHILVSEYTVVGALLGGLIYGYVRYETNSLWPSIILHGVWNAQIFILVYLA